MFQVKNYLAAEMKDTDFMSMLDRAPRLRQMPRLSVPSLSSCDISQTLRKASTDLLQTSSLINLMENMTGLQVIVTETWRITRDVLTEIEILLGQSPPRDIKPCITKIPAKITKARYLYLVIRDARKTFELYAQVFDNIHNLYQADGLAVL